MNEEIYKICFNKIIDKYKKEIVPQVEPFEKERLGYLKKYKILTGIIWGIFAIVFVYMIYWAVSHHTPIPPRRIIGIPLSFLGFWVMVCRNIGKDFKYSVRNDLMPIICKSFPYLKWITGQSNTKNEYQKSYIIPGFERIKYGDCFLGKYKNNDFYLEEVSAIGKIEKKSAVVFTGAIIQFELLNKDLKSHTIMHPTTENKNIPVKNIKYLKSIMFDETKKYDIYTTNENQANIFINEGLIKILNDIKKVYNAQNVYVSFFQGNFYLGLYTIRKHFTGGSFTKPIITDEKFNNFANEIVSILKIIDYFNYNENIKN